jgi:hypothetical protein
VISQRRVVRGGGAGEGERLIIFENSGIRLYRKGLPSEMKTRFSTYDLLCSVTELQK